LAWRHLFVPPSSPARPQPLIPSHLGRRLVLDAVLTSVELAVGTVLDVLHLLRCRAIARPAGVSEASRAGGASGSWLRSAYFGTE
jgi:hypothetical protein